MQYGSTSVIQQQAPFIIYTTFTALGDLPSERQVNKEVILHLWDAIDYSDLEQLARTFLLGTFHQLEIAAQEHVGYSEESKAIML